MSNPLLAYRVYASNYTSIENLQSVKLKKDIHVVLAFARDYNSSGTPTRGVFDCYFDKTQLTPTAIETFRQNSASRVKFFLSIGGRNPKYPFCVTSSDKSIWIANATTSLKKIIGDYQLDGIDVYYQHVRPDAAGQFQDAIGQVIENLKDDLDDKFQVSLTVSAPLCGNYYEPLFRQCSKVIDAVVYQTHSWLTVIKSSQSLLDNVLKRLPYPQNKLFAGHSTALPTDWNTVSMPIFLGAVPHLLEQSPVASGISHWIVTSDADPEK